MNQITLITNSTSRRLAVATLVGLASMLMVTPAEAIEGTELNGSVGLWAPLFPEFQVGAATTDSDEIGALVELSGHHRFDGYRTSMEGSVFYGDAGDISLFGYEGLLRDTWSFGIGDLSAGFGYSQLNFDQDFAGADLESDYRGAKVVGGWERMFGRSPLWIDLGLGLYDLDGTYTAPGGAEFYVNEFATTFSVEMKTDVCLWGVAARPSMKVEYLSDIASYQAGQLDTDDGVILSAMIELRLMNR